MPIPVFIGGHKPHNHRLFTRIWYEIFGHNKSAFHERFRDRAARIMRKCGFHIVAMWEAKTDQRTEFVYLLAWPDEAAKSTAWAEFMSRSTSRWPGRYRLWPGSMPHVASVRSACR